MGERNLDFDTVVNRRNTDCLKYDFAARRGMPEDILPFWVADMDFKTSSYIEDALVNRAKEAIFGYSDIVEEYYEAVAKWMKRRHDWDVKPEWLVKTPGVVFALAMAVKAYTNEGDKVLIQLPVYYPFKEVIEDNNRVLVSNDLYLGDDNKYHMDIEDFEKKIVDNDVKIFILCSPHNPVGRVWTRAELEAVGDICLKHGVIVLSDEIHNDFIFEGEHTIFTKVKKEYEDISLVCTSASKTFNLATMLMSNIFIPNDELRDRFTKQIAATGTSQLGIFGLIATMSAYTEGDVWYDSMKAYVKANIDFTRKFVEDNLPGVTMIEHEGTYLLWLDFNGTGLTSEKIDDIIINKAKLWLDSGKIFGKMGEGFQRINVACPRQTLVEGLERIKKSFQ